MICATIIAREPEEPGHEQLKEGNLAVTGTMQVGPFLGFGQNIITKNESIASVFTDWLIGKDQKHNEMLPYFVYAPRDDLSLFLSFPTVLSAKEGEHHSSGSGDLVVQLEYAFYANHLPHATNQLTLVTSVYLPTGNECKNPATGLGLPSFFLGTTAMHLANRMMVILLMLRYLQHHTIIIPRLEINFFIRVVLVKILHIKQINGHCCGWWNFMGGMNKNRKPTELLILTRVDNCLLFGPSLWFSTNRMFLQAGIVPAVKYSVFLATKQDFLILGHLALVCD